MKYIKINSEQFEANKVRFVKCDTWDDYIREIREERYLAISETEVVSGHGPIFRGHASPEWRLSSRLERALIPQSEIRDENGEVENTNFRKMNGLQWYDNLCQELLTKFVENAAGLKDFPRNLPISETWALGRHYGLLTPYLDWTESPYIAAFFAFSELYKKLEFNSSIYTSFDDGFVRIWALRLWGELEKKDEFSVIYVPRYFGSRIWAQSGLFTNLRSQEFVDLESYLLSQELGHYLECYELPYSSAHTALRDLEQMNLTFSSLFPDLTGAAQQANIMNDVLLTDHFVKSLKKK